MTHRSSPGRILAVFVLCFILVMPACAPTPGSLILALPNPIQLQQDSPTATPEAPTPAESAAGTPASAPVKPLSGVVGVSGFPAGVNPLTGLPAEYPSLLDRRPIMVKVSNYPPSVRPQSGLSFADIVFEYYIGEGTNRFLALFYSQDAFQVGSLRSGRLVDAQLARMYQSFLVYGSADVRVDKVLNEELGDRAISNLEVPCPVVCGGDTHRAPWVYANTGEVESFIQKSGYDNNRHNLNGMIFDSTPPKTEQYGISIGVQYMLCNRGEWRYDTNSGMYLRWIEKWDNSHECKSYPLEPLTDYLTKQQLSFANVMILFTDYHEYNPTLHDIYMWDKTTSQRAVFYRDGEMINGSWRAVSHDQPLQFFNQYGLPMALKPGNSWIILADNHSSFNESQTGVWELGFSLK
jgi:hypothetical protein